MTKCLLADTVGCVKVCETDIHNSFIAKLEKAVSCYIRVVQLSPCSHLSHLLEFFVPFRYLFIYLLHLCTLCPFFSFSPI